MKRNTTNHNNFRDVAESIVGPSSPLLMPGRIYRCGAIDWCEYDSLRMPQTVINLRNEQEEESSCPSLVENGVKFISCPKPKRIECYDTAHVETRQWLKEFVQLFENPDLISYPVIIHCKAGRDRTGVAIAALLTILQVPEESILCDYCIGPVTPQHEQMFQQALDGLKVKGSISKYFAGVNLKLVRKNLTGSI